MQTQTAVAEAVQLAQVGTVAASETTLRSLDPAAAAAFGIGAGVGIDRRKAMRVPGIRRGRNLIAGTIGTLPLVCARRTSDGAVSPVDRLLLRQLDPRTTPAYTLTWTIDDLIFHGVSWWRVTARDSAGWPTAVERLKPGRVVVDVTAGHVYVDGERASDADLIRFDGPDEGLLTEDGGADIVQLALSLIASARRNADDDVPTMLLSLVQGAPELKREEILDLLDEWESARSQRRTAYTNAAINASTLNFDAQKRQLHELNQMCASELARLMNLPASRIGAPQGGSMVYASVEADRRDLVDTTLRLYLAPVSQRLSMPDVTPAGQAVTWDLTAYLRGDTESLVKAGAEAIDAGITDADEVRTEWLGLPPRATPATTPTPREDTDA